MSDFARAVRKGLSRRPKSLPCLYLYDERGSALFEEITGAPEYYITRVELDILERRAAEIVACSDGDMALIELGSGSSLKTRVLIEAFLALQGRLRYAPIDVSPSILERSSTGLLRSFDRLSVASCAAEYEPGLAWARRQGFGQRMILWLGSSVGNFSPAGAAAILGEIRRTLGRRDRLLLGADLHKDARVLEAAYNDASGVTARFNLNLLRRINNELGGRFEREAFRHRAFYNEAERRVEMHLESRRRQVVPVEALETAFAFSRGETIHTEDSYKYSASRLRDLAALSGFRCAGSWRDSQGYYSLNLWEPLEGL